MIKRLVYIIIVIFYLLAISSMAFASEDTVYYMDEYRGDAPKKFTAVGMQYPDNYEPFRQIQNMLVFNFVDNKEIHEQFKIEYDDDGSAHARSIHIIDFYMTYNQSAYEDGSSIFITGTVTYDYELDGVTEIYTGDITGKYVYIEDHFNDSFNGKSAIRLRLDFEDPYLIWEIFLEQPEELAYIQEEIFNEDMYYYDEHSAHIPGPSTQKDVAIGVGVSTIGIVALNSLTNTSVFGSTSFNSTFSPTSPPSAGSSPVPQAGSNAATAETSGVFNSIKKFFKLLWDNLRDLLTDEGRSYASGKVSDVLENTEIDDIGSDD